MAIDGRSSIRKARCDIALVLAVCLLVYGCNTEAGRSYRVGILCGLDVFASTVDGFKARMTELGYVEGRNMEYNLQRTNFHPEEEWSILRRFVADKVDLIVALPSEVALAAKKATLGTTIPLVFCQTNVEGIDLIQDLREPGGNITGVRYPGPDLALKRFEILHELVPSAKRIWVPYSMLSPIVPSQLAMLRPVAKKAGVTLVEAPAADAAALAADLESRTRGPDIGIDAILFISEPLARTPAAFLKIGELAARHNLPIGGVHYSLGGYTTLFGVATDNLAVGRLAAQQANKIFKGIPAGTIPIVSAESYFQLNLSVAQALGIQVSEGLLRQADEVIR